MRTFLVTLALAGLLALPAHTQSGGPAKGPFGGFKHDRTAPLEVTSDSLEVRQAEGRAIFTGNVIAGQGTLRLTSKKMIVEFDEDKEGGDSETGAITRVEATGDVFVSNGAETAQGEWAEYDLETGLVKMRGGVILTQGGNAGKGESLSINLNTGVARLGGRVTLSFISAKGKEVPLPDACKANRLAATASELNIAEKFDLVCVPKDSTN